MGKRINGLSINLLGWITTVINGRGCDRVGPYMGVLANPEEHSLQEIISPAWVNEKRMANHKADPAPKKLR
jgi:hypothetical protein